MIDFIIVNGQMPKGTGALSKCIVYWQPANWQRSTLPDPHDCNIKTVFSNGSYSRQVPVIVSHLLLDMTLYEPDHTQNIKKTC